MITLPDSPAPNGAVVRLIDFGETIVPALGAKVLRRDADGNRHAVEISWPPMVPAVARVFISRLLRAKSEGLRIELPLVDHDQGNPGAPVVDGASNEGTSLSLRDCSPRHLFREGYWISVANAAGENFLYNIGADTEVGADGTATVPLDVALRFPHDDGDAVEAAKPVIEGYVEGGTWEYAIPLNGFVSLSVVIVEAQ